MRCKVFMRVYVTYLTILCCSVLICTALYQARKIRLLEEKLTIQFWDSEETKNSILWKLTDKQDEAACYFEKMKEKERALNQIEVKSKLQEEQIFEVESQNEQLKERIRSLEMEAGYREERISKMTSALQQEQTQESYTSNQLKSTQMEVDKLKTEVFQIKNLVNQPSKQQDNQDAAFANKNGIKQDIQIEQTDKKYFNELNINQLGTTSEQVKTKSASPILGQKQRSRNATIKPERLAVSQNSTQEPGQKKQDQFPRSFDSDTDSSYALQNLNQNQNNKYQTKSGEAAYINIGESQLILEN